MSIPRELINSGTTREQYHFDRYLDAAAREGRKLANRGPASSPTAPAKELTPSLREAYFTELLEARVASSTGESGSAALSPAGGNPWQRHPLWSEWAALRPAYREACEQNFPSFLDLRRQGRWGQFEEFVNESLAATIAEEERDRARRGRAAANVLHVSDAGGSRARQADFQRQIAEARELGRRHGAVR